MKNYNMNSGKKYLDRAKKNDAATSEYLDNYYKNLREEAQAEEARLNEQAMSGARFTNASRIARSRQRVQSLTEELNYTNNAATIGMTEVVSQIVESALLVDAEAYAELNPNYKEEIRETVRGFLENANISEEVTNDTLRLYEYVSETLPDVKQGKFLTEDGIASLFDKEKPVDVEMSIKKLSGNISERVANLVEKEQKKIDKINQDMVDAGVVDPATGEGQVPAEAPEAEQGSPMEDPNAVPAEGKMPAEDPNAVAPAEPSPEAQEIMAQIEQGQLDPAALEDIVNSGQIAPEVADEVMTALNGSAPEGEMPAEDPNAMQDPNAQMDPAAQGMAPQQGTGKSIHIDPNGNTSVSMPNGQLALNQDGSIDIRLAENKLVRETARCGLIESLAVNEATNMIKEGKEYNSDLCIANALMYVTITEAMDELGLLDVNEQVYSEIINRAGGNVSNNSDSGCAKRQTKQEYQKNLKESATTIWGVQQNPQTDDFAERIRQKKLNRE